MLTIRSLRWKMLVPAIVAMIATLIATLVTLGLSGRAASKLEDARTRNLPALLFHQEMHAKLAQLDALMKFVGESRRLDDKIDLAEQVHMDMQDRFQAEGAAVLGPAESQKLLADLDKYWADANVVAAQKVSNRLKFEAERCKNPNWEHASGASIAEIHQTGVSAAVENYYQALYARFEQGAKNAQAAMNTALGEANAEQRQAVLWGAVILVVFACGGMVAAWLLSGSTARPVQNLSKAALRIAQGDLTEEVKVESEDEIGVLARSFQRMVTRLRELVSTLKSASEQMATAAEQLSDHTRAQSGILERQASGVAETSSTTRQLEQTSSVAASRAAAVLDVARRATEMSDSGSTAAERSAGELARIQASIDGIVSQSTQLLQQTRQVGDIVETVRDLATQSHVLSLNASIEAAKAGEAGRSFAVVAQEVRALAEQSGSGANRIGKMVEEILTAVQSTRDMTERGSVGMSGSLNEIRASGESLREIGGIVRETSDAALHIASAVQQQSTGIAQIATAMRDLDKGMEEAVGRIRALEQSAQLVAETATRISGVAEEFKL
jgi:methyl-accepting chemotaxis protein